MTADVHELAGAYALHGLPADEQLFFERHVAACETCAVEVEEFLATAAMLGAACEDTPPPVLRQQVLSAVDVIRQAPPVAQPAPPPRRWGRRTTESLLASVAAALAVALLVLSGVTVHLNERLVEVETALPATDVDDRALAVLAAPDARTRSLAGGGTAAGRFVYSSALDTGVFVARGMDPLSTGSTYQLWLFHEGTPHPATLFAVDDRGQALMVVEGSVAGAAFAAVTVEPHGGSPAPTGEVVVGGAV